MRRTLFSALLGSIVLFSACERDTPEPDEGGGGCRQLGASCTNSTQCCGALSCMNGICDARVTCQGKGERCGPGVSCCGALSCTEVAPNNRVCSDGLCASRGQACGGGITCCGTDVCRSNVCQP